jgi:hypothetical protein
MKQPSFIANLAIIGICGILIALWAGFSADKCKQAYGPSAELHGTKFLNECNVDGEIRPLPQ